MQQTWRWFGSHDPISIDDILQVGARGVVTALHHVPPGEIWHREQIELRKADVERRSNGSRSHLDWEVVESLPVSEEIKILSGEWRQHIENYKISLRNLASCGIRTVCYNFMPVLDWTRTDFTYRLPNGGTCMHFDIASLAAFDIWILGRKGAQQDYVADVREKAKRVFSEMDDLQRERLANSIASGLPGSVSSYTLDDLRDQLAQYENVDVDQLRANLVDFLSEVVPTAEEVGIRMCCHPDDPPFGLLGLPRIVSTLNDCRHFLKMVDSPANGLTFCSGSLGARSDNDLPSMLRELGDRVHFLHLRNVKRHQAPSSSVTGSFYEAEHMDGDTDMVALVGEVVREERRRRIAGRLDWSIPMRPDHGQNLLDDLQRETRPGYPLIGRMRGLAELRGTFAAFEHTIMEKAG